MGHFSRSTDTAKYIATNLLDEAVFKAMAQKKTGHIHSFASFEPPHSRLQQIGRSL